MLSDVERLRKYGGAAPRYTSYPTAPHFTPEINAQAYRRWLSEITPQARGSAYLHVPYCKQLCWYCGCNMRATQSYKPVARYAETLAREFAIIAGHASNAPTLDHVHWGGGSPTILSGGDFMTIMTALREAFPVDSDAEIAIEVDPRTMTEAKAELLAAAGVNRASLGVQTFAPDVQEAINRRQSRRCVARAVAILRAAGVKLISVDLMYGLPHQTVANVEEAAELCAEMGPDRVSVFGYAHVPWMKRHQQLMPEEALPGESDRWAQAQAAARALTGLGYQAIGMDHFALPEDALAQRARRGELRRNFQGYTDDAADYLIGFGASAISSCPQGYMQNITTTPEYHEAVKAGRLPVARGVEIDDEDRLRREIIERFMCDFSMDLDQVCENRGVSSDRFADEIAALREFEQDGLVRLNGAKVSIVPEGRPYVRSVCAVFDAYLKLGKARHSRAI